MDVFLNCKTERLCPIKEKKEGVALTRESSNYVMNNLRSILEISKISYLFIGDSL